MVILFATNKAFSRYFEIDYYCPENFSKVSFSIDYLIVHVGISIPVIFLGAGGGLLNIKDAIDFIFEHLVFGCKDPYLDDLQSRNYKEKRLADERFKLIKAKINSIDLETWGIAFEKLFYVAACWLRDNVDFNEPGSEGVFQILWNDFNFLPVAHQTLFFPPSPPHQLKKEQRRAFEEYVYNWVISNSRIFLEEEKSKIEKEDFHDPEYREDFESILEGWSMRYFEGEIPKIVQEYEKKMNG